jgi:hypothetical protein
MTTLVPKIDFKNGGSTPSGAINRSSSDKIQDIYSVKDFGAKGDGTTDDTVAFNNAILAVAIAGGGTIIAPNASYLISGTILIPSNIHLDLQNSTITGSGIGSATDLFQSAYLSGGVITTNIGTSPESHNVSNSIVTNGIIKNTGKCFNLYDFLDNCEISNIHFTDCTYAIYANRCFYCRFINLFSRGTASSATNAAFYFGAFVNVEQIESVFAVGRTLGIEVIAGANGLKFLNCSAETCTTGVLVSGEEGPIEFDTCYFEGNTTYGVDMNTGGFKNVAFNNCFFNANATAIRGELTGGANVKIYENNYFLNNTVNVLANDNFYNYGLTEIPPAVVTDNQLPTFPSTYSLGTKSRVNFDTILFNSNSGLIEARTKTFGPTIAPFYYSGDSGSGPVLGVAFCTNSFPTSATSTIVITTTIPYRSLTAFLAYRFYIVDNSGSYLLYGFIFGDTVKQMDSVGKTFTVAQDGNGNIQLSIGTFNNPSGTATIVGAVRHI